MVLLLVSPSCKKILDEEVISGVTEQYLNTKPGFESAVKASYSGLRIFFASGEMGMTLTEFGTDMYTHGADGDFKHYDLYDTKLNSRDAMVRDLWNNFYTTINTCNIVIDRAASVPGIDDATKNKSIGEARWLRAQYYFILVQTFGPIHLALKENSEITTEAKRSSVKEVYDAIVADLEFAIANLPVTQADYGRATKPAAENLLAKVLLTRAYIPEAAQPTDFARAAELGKNVINNYNFRLLDDFADIFKQGAGEVNAEVIWAVQYTTDKLNDGNGNRMHPYYVMQYDILPGMVRDLENGKCFKRLRPTNFALANFGDRTVDSRYNKSFKVAWISNNAANIPKDAAGKPKFAVGDTAIWLPGKNLAPEEVAKKPYLVILPKDYTETKYPSLIKFMDKTRSAVNDDVGSRDYLAYRLADTYLMVAEAYIGAGNLAEATTYINKVRERAAYPGKKALMDLTPDKLNIDTLLNERGRELSGELCRWFDLNRTGKLVERVKLYNDEGKKNIQPFHVLRPIPQDQIDRTTNNFGQNTGY
ncbi:RagB/SusD family nutrient uptake outer membrane protein [Pedobacter sp. HMF7647]|uniref:RagB/SusD family nutrient uptake outer membrane protein n=2 Tax=Hufsiella arboris TaxID=2695275 RepID=A0A7K1YCG2_9SPHI|nr:RagB/SusD family nutrient uptake outer membrane protein [Hufsiella arboris]